MKNILPKVIVIGATLIILTLVILRFLTLQSMDISNKNFFLYNINADKLFRIENDNNRTFVEIYDKKRVKLSGIYTKNGDYYRVYPFTDVIIKDKNLTVIYRFMADSLKKSFSYPVNRWHKYEIIGGAIKNPNPKRGREQHLARLTPNDKPTIAIFPEQIGRKTFANTSSLYIVALQDGIKYIDTNGTTYKLKRHTKRELDNITKSQLTKINEGGYITFKRGNHNIVLAIGLKNGFMSIKRNGKYINRKIKFLTISEYNNFTNIKSLNFVYGNNEAYTLKDQWRIDNIEAKPKKFLKFPYKIDIEKSITIKGRASLMKYNKYNLNSDYTRRVPRLDKPIVYKGAREQKRKNYIELLDIDHMYGLYVSDKNATVYFSEDGISWVKAQTNYKYSPPLYLYNPKIDGLFVAPEIFKDRNSTIFYKVVSKKRNYKIAFNGKVEIFDKSMNKILDDDSSFIKQIPINSKTIIIKAQTKPPQECGYLFELDRKINGYYKLAYKHKEPFIIKKYKNVYRYYIKEALNPFTTNNIKIYLNNQEQILNYRPQLSCKYRLPIRKNYIPSLYMKDNMVQLIAKDRERRVTNIKVAKQKSKKKTNSSNSYIIEPELIPIYGDGINYGLLSKNISSKDLTLDKNFTLQVAQIFKDEIKKLKKNHNLINKIKNSNEIIEGATVVIGVKNETPTIKALFSYPYPTTSNNLERERIIATLRKKFSLIKNRAFSLRVHPGSTFKIVTSIALAKQNKLNNFTILKNSTDLYNLPFRKGRIGFHLRNYGKTAYSRETTQYTDYEHAFAHSYNTYFGYAGLVLHNRLNQHYSDTLLPVLLDEKEKENEFELIKVAQELFFNKKIVLSSKKNISTEASLFPTTFIYPKEVADSAIGQFEVYATPMNMALVTLSIYSNKIIIPSILKDEEPKVISKQLLSNDKIEKIREAMQMVVEEGTAKKVFKNLNLNGVKIYGKTGTAQKGKKGLYDGWFVSFTKGLKEDLIIATVITNSGTGATHSAPINRKIVEAWIKQNEPNKLKKAKKP